MTGLFMPRFVLYHVSALYDWCYDELEDNFCGPNPTLQTAGDVLFILRILFYYSSDLKKYIYNILAKRIFTALIIILIILLL